MCPVLRRSSFNIDMGDMVIQYTRELTSCFPVLLNSTQHCFLFYSVASVLLTMTSDSRRPHTVKKEVPFPAQCCPGVPSHITKMEMCDCSFSLHAIDFSDQSSGFSFMATFLLQTLLVVKGGL